MTLLEAELEAKRSEQEQRHEECILSMMMSFMNEVAGHLSSPRVVVSSKDMSSLDFLFTPIA